MTHPYQRTADELTRRIAALGPQILTLKSVFDLTDVGLRCEDLQPSLAQAQVAFARARVIVRDAPPAVRRGVALDGSI